MKYLAIATLLSLSSFANAQTSIGVGYQMFDLTAAAENNELKFKNNTVVGTLSYAPSDYVKASVFAGMSVDEDELNKATDTYRDITGGDIQSRTLRSVAEIDYVAGAEFSFVLPTTSHLSFQFDAGYLTAPWESEGYPGFVDNEPAEDFEQAIADQLNQCQITGIEDEYNCGALNEISDKGRISGPYVGVSLNWSISDMTTIRLSGNKSLGDSKGEFSSIGLSLSFAW